MEHQKQHQFSIVLVRYHFRQYVIFNFTKKKDFLDIVCFNVDGLDFHNTLPLF